MTPKGKAGRPKKTGFRGFPKKLKFDIVADDCNIRSNSNQEMQHLDPILVHKIVVCDECGNKITITDPEIKKVKCLSCNCASRVSDLKLASPGEVTLSTICKNNHANDDKLPHSNSKPDEHADNSQERVTATSDKSTVCNVVICDECGSKITITDSELKKVKCPNCNCRSRVSDLKLASPDEVGLSAICKENHANDDKLPHSNIKPAELPNYSKKKSLLLPIKVLSIRMLYAMNVEVK